MVAHVIERLAPQVDEILVNANRNPEAYAAFGHRVIADEIPGFAGPLAGFERGLAHARGELVATVPCDSPFLPAGPGRAAARRARSGGRGPRRGEDGRRRPTPSSASCAAPCTPRSRDFLASGQRKIDKWYAALAVVEVAFDDEADAFANINTRDELADLEKPHMTKLTIAQASCADDYDPNSMPVDKARAFIHRFLEPRRARTLRVPIRGALGPRARRGRGLARGRALAPQLRDGRLGDARRGPGGRTRKRRSRRSAPPSPAGPSRAAWARASACAS